ncbi:MAG: hypothetical protein HY847_02420 [Betaproteobacteria bacterium]|nr:hypothetical protein [Betaproteobacteria bacterium]
MTNHPNRSKIISLSPIKPSAQIQGAVDVELHHQATGAANPGEFKNYLCETNNTVAIIGLNGLRYHISAMKVMLDDDLRLKPEFEKAVIEDAVRQAVRKQYPDRRHIQVNISWGGSNVEEGYFECQAGVWWNYRRQYEEIFFYVRY